MTRDLVDVLIVVAAEGEDEAVRAVEDGGLEAWEKRTGPQGFAFPVWRRRYQTANGGELGMAMCRAFELGAESTAYAAARLVGAYQPRCLAMCGVCAGNPHKLQLGDVIIADRAYRYDVGETVQITDGAPPQFRADTMTWPFRAVWKQAAEKLALPEPASWLADRPVPRTMQADWVLKELGDGRNPLESPDRARCCADWTSVVRQLQEDRLIRLKRGNPELTAIGRTRIQQMLFDYAGDLPAQAPWRIHVGPLGTGSTLVRDAGIWDRLGASERHILGLDMEGSVIGFTAHVQEMESFIVVKGVMDYADKGRSQGFRTFAARAAAEVLIAFLRQHLEPTTRIESPLVKPGQEASESSDSPWPICNLKYPANPHFTGRDELLERLAEARKPSQTAAVQAIHGLGGVGKTQLVLEYAYRNAASFRVVWWVQSESPLSLTRDYSQLSAELGLVPTEVTDQDVLIRAVRHWLEHNEDWLLVFDNATDEASLADYLPRAKTGQVIITSRNPQWSHAQLLPLPVLPREESIKFLRASTSLEEFGGMGELAEEVGDLPLALAQAAGYIRTAAISATEYLQRFRDRRRELWGSESTPHDYDKTIATAWKTSLKELPESATDLLRFCSFFGPEAIPRSLLNRDLADLPGTLSAILREDLERDEAIGHLRRYSLMEANPSELSVHRLVQAVVRDGLDDGARRKWSEAALRVVVDAFRYDHLDPRVAARMAPLLPHVESVVEHTVGMEDLTDLAAQLVNDAAMSLWQLVRSSDARRLLKRALDVQTPSLPGKHPALAVTFANLGVVEATLGNLPDGKAALGRAIAIGEEAYGPEHKNLAAPYANLGWVEMELANLNESRRLLRKAIEISQSTLPQDHPDVAIRYANLAAVEKADGNLEEARRLLRQAIDILEKTLPRNHPTLATNYSDLANVERELGNIPEARRLLEQAIGIDEEAFPSGHPNVAVRYNNLALIEKAAGNLDEARRLLMQALEINKKFLDPSDAALATSYSNLAAVERGLDHFPEARDLFERAREIRERALPDGHPTLAATYSNLAVLEQDLGNLNEARELLLRAINVLRSHFDEAHPSLATCYNNLAYVERAQGHTTEARQHMRQAHEIRLQRLGEQHPLTKQCARWLQEN